MGYPPEMMNAKNGMVPPYSPSGPRHTNDPNPAFPNHATYHGSPAYQVPIPQTGYLANNYAPAPYAPMNSMNQQFQPFPQIPSPFAQRPTGFAVVIPSPSQSDHHRAPSMPAAPRQPTQTTQRTVSTPKHVPKPAAPVPATPQSPFIDYQLLLLSLAEEYFGAAHGQVSFRTKDRENNMCQYYRLVAAGLACLETVIKQFKLQPQMEASVRLRYASVLYDETENMLEAEQCLSDGIKLCDRHRFFDFKYNMEHLLAQVLFKGSPRASMKFLDGVIKDAEAYQHTAWVYVLRFLKVTLLLQLSSHQDVLSAFTQLRSISTLADQSGDKAILAIVSTLEGLVHLRDSSSAESIEQAQRALALARSLQYDPDVGQISQLAVLTNVVDLSCSLQQFDPTQAVSKMQAMQASLESPHDTRSADGSFLIPVPSQEASRAPNGNGIVRKDPKGSISVMFNWAPWTDLYALGYLLSSISIFHRNTPDGLRSEQMLKEGLRWLHSKRGISLGLCQAYHLHRKCWEDRLDWGANLGNSFKAHLATSLEMFLSIALGLRSLHPHSMDTCPGTIE